MEFTWVDGSEISARIDGEQIVISANREGLISLAENLRQSDR